MSGNYLSDEERLTVLGDGESIVKLEAFADRILQFKQNPKVELYQLFLINGLNK